MVAQKGSLMLVKVGNGAVPEVFTTIGGVRTSRIIVNNQMMDNSHIASGQWRSLAAAGLKSLTIQGRGIFVDSASEETVRGLAFSSSVCNYQLYFAKGDYCTGAFYISQYERIADHDDVEQYAVTLMSAGPVSYTS
jgi:TP901-1 family phage major tail protein